MRIAFLVLGVDLMGGTERTAINQAAALAERHDVRIVSVLRHADRPHAALDPRVPVDYLVDARDPARPTLATGTTPAHAADLLQRPSVLVPTRWDAQFHALADIGLERGLPDLDTDVVVTMTPGLLAAAVQLLPSRTVVVHQEHRPSAQRTAGLEPLVTYGPQADVIALLTQDSADWLATRLGAAAPALVVVPNPLPAGFSPRSTLDGDLIVSGGRLMGEKQFHKLIDAFAMIAGDLPTWRLRILGTGPLRNQLVRQVRQHDLWDRVELPGSVTDMPTEWAGASICALTSRNEALPLLLQEAMAAGVPCVSFDTCTGPRDLIRHGVNGLLVTQESIAGMAAALHRLATDAGERASMGAAALASVQPTAGPLVAARWEQVFTAAVAARAGRGRFEAVAARPHPAVSAPPAPDVAGVTPAQARTAILALAVEATRATSSPWLVVPPHETGVPVVVLPMPARDAFLEALAAADHPAYVSVLDPARGGWPERRGLPAALAQDLRRGRTPWVVLEPWPDTGADDEASTSPLAQGCSVEVEFWEVGLDGQWVSPRLNRYTQRLPATPDTVEAEVDGVTVRTLP